MSAKFFFQFSQFLILGAVVVALVMFRRRPKYTPGISDVDMQRARETISKMTKAEVAPVQVVSALPEWTKDTAAHTVLGVPADAKREVIEAAFKALLKKYHPDKYASWGGDYQTRAHNIVILLQSAHEKMRTNKMKS